MTTAKVDMELKKVQFTINSRPILSNKMCFQAFVELQGKQIDTTQQLKIADVQIEGLKRNKLHAFLTEKY